MEVFLEFAGAYPSHKLCAFDPTVKLFKVRRAQVIPDIH